MLIETGRSCLYRTI